jgi:GAF domain-containing protein
VNIAPEVLAGSLQRVCAGERPDTDEALHRVIGACVDLFGVDGSGLMVADQQNALRYVAASDGPGRVLEDVQSETGQGPCVDTFVTNETVTTADMAEETRWPESREVIAEHGVRAVLGVPVRLGGVPVGSLDVYRARPHAWDDSERAALARYSEVVEAILGAALSAHAAGELADQLQYALDHRVVIERAVGFLMARAEVDAVTAFNIMRTMARNERRKVAEVAQELLDAAPSHGRGRRRS